MNIPKTLEVFIDFFCATSTIRGTTNVIFPTVLKQPTNTKAVVHFYPCQTNTQVTSRSLSTPNTNRLVIQRLHSCQMVICFLHV